MRENLLHTRNQSRLGFLVARHWIEISAREQSEGGNKRKKMLLLKSQKLLALAACALCGF